MLLFKAGFWVLAVLFVYTLMAGLIGRLKSLSVSSICIFLLPICLLVIGFKLALSVAPGFIDKAVKKIAGFIGKLLVKALVWLLGKIWEILR